MLKRRHLPEETDEYIELDTVDTVSNEVKMKEPKEPEEPVHKHAVKKEKK